MLKYSDALTNTVLSIRPIFQYSNGDTEHYNPNTKVTYLVRDKKILCHGHRVFSYDNMDYEFNDGNNALNLMRNGKLLYKTEPKQTIRSGKRNGAYCVYSKHYKFINTVYFPPTISVLDVVDNKLKGE